MRPKKRGPGAALAGADGAAGSTLERERSPNIMTPAAAPALRQLRRQRAVERLYRLGVRPVFELVDELARHHPELAGDIDDRLAAYVERLSPELLRATGGN